MSEFKNYDKEELNSYINKVIRTDLRDLTKDSVIKKIVKKYRAAKGVYKIIDLTDNRIYVRSTSDKFRLIHRLKIHWRELVKRTHFNSHLQCCFDKHGEEKFSFEIIEFYDWDDTKTLLENKTAIEKREQYYIDTLGGRDKNKGFNQADHAHGRFNWVTWETLETRTNLTIAQMKQILDKLVNTNNICRDIDREIGIPMGTALKIYKRQTLSKLTENYIFMKRDTSQRGELSATGKLTEVQVLEIIERLKMGTSIPEMAKKYGVDKASIHDIKNGRNWVHLTKRVKFYDYPKVKKDSDLPSIYQYSLDGSYQKEWTNYREAARYYGLLSSSINEGIKSNALYLCNHLWSYEKKDYIIPKAPIELFFYYNNNGKEDAFFEVNGGKPCDCCVMVFVPLVLFDLKEKKYLWAWKTKSELAKKVTGKARIHLFDAYNIYQNRYKLLPMRDVPKEDLVIIKGLLENGEEMDYSILGYQPDSPNRRTKFPILPENQIDYTQI